VLTQLIGPSDCTSLSIVAHSCIAMIGFHKTTLGATTAAVGKRVLRRRRRRDPHIDRVHSGANCAQPRRRRRREFDVDSLDLACIRHCGYTLRRPQVSPWRAQTNAWGVHRCADVTNLHPRMIHICNGCISTVIAQRSSEEKCQRVRVCIRRLSVSVT